MVRPGLSWAQPVPLLVLPPPRPFLRASSGAARAKFSPTRPCYVPLSAQASGDAVVLYGLLSPDRTGTDVCAAKAVTDRSRNKHNGNRRSVADWWYTSA